MKIEIRQNNRTVLTSDCIASMRVIFRNLTKQNFTGQEYSQYIQYVAIPSMGFNYGKIEYVEDDIVKEIGIIQKA